MTSYSISTDGNTRWDLLLRDQALIQNIKVPAMDIEIKRSKLTTFLHKF